MEGQVCREIGGLMVEGDIKFLSNYDKKIQRWQLGRSSSLNYDVANLYGVGVTRGLYISTAHLTEDTHYVGKDGEFGESARVNDGMLLGIERPDDMT